MDYTGFLMLQDDDTFSLSHPVLTDDYSLNRCNNVSKLSFKRQILIIEAQFEL